MLRRNLTKIELKLEDLNDLNALHEKNKLENVTNTTDKSTNAEPIPQYAKTRALVESRIGYNPRPRRTN